MTPRKIKGMLGEWRTNPPAFLEARMLRQAVFAIAGADDPTDDRTNVDNEAALAALLDGGDVAFRIGID